MQLQSTERTHFIFMGKVVGSSEVTSQPQALQLWTAGSQVAGNYFRGAMRDREVVPRL